MSQTHAATRAASRALIDDETGAAMVEHGVMVRSIAAACMVIITTIGGQTNAVFTTLNTAGATA